MKLEPSQLSIIIPVGPGDETYLQLLSDLQQFFPQDLSYELVLVGTTLLPSQNLLQNNNNNENKNKNKKNIIWIQSKPGRGLQLNLGANSSSGSILWFLHSDSRLNDSTCASLQIALKDLEKNSDLIYYHNLCFLSDGSPLTKINAWGANLRSQIFGLPFGDQGFCLSREVFRKLGSFPEHLNVGEDHAFIWKAKIKKIPIKSTGGPLWTSARKYQQRGWLRTTLQHFFLTLSQASRFFRLYREQRDQHDHHNDHDQKEEL